MHAVGEGVALVLRHVEMSNLVAVYQSEQPPTYRGGAVFVRGSALVVEHSIFRANFAYEVIFPFSFSRVGA